MNDCARRMTNERNAISEVLNIYQHFRLELKWGKMFLVEKSFSIQNQFFSSNHDVIQFSFIFFHSNLNQSILYPSYIISLLNKVDEYGRIKNYLLGEPSKFRKKKSRNSSVCLSQKQPEVPKTKFGPTFFGTSSILLQMGLVFLVLFRF